MNEIAISTESLTKNFRNTIQEAGIKGALRGFVSPKYRTIPAVQDFSFTINKGEIVGLLGPNGAGKTTLMKMFTGIIAPSSGSVNVLGYVPFERNRILRKKVALVMGQKSQLWWDIPAIESFNLLQRYYEVSNKNYLKRLNLLTSLLGVEKLLEVHVRKLSLGERMKMELIACLLHEPEVLFLDEPTIGLDLVSQKNIRTFLLDYQREHKTTILLTSHYMADVQALCSRIVLILGGEKRFDGSLGSFESILGKEKFVAISFSESVSKDDSFWTNLNPVWNEDFTRVEVRIPENDFRSITKAILDKYPVNDLSTEKLPIERVMETLMRSPELV